MRKGGGRAKGSGFERMVARTVIEAFKEFGIRKEDCYRTPLSGGHRAARKKDPGDLVISKKLLKYFPFSVECKFYKKLYLPALWMPQKQWKKNWNFGPWLKQTCKACGSNRMPLLIFKGNGTPTFAALPRLAPLMLGGRPVLTFRYESEDWCVILFNRLLRRLRNHARQKNV